MSLTILHPYVEGYEPERQAPCWAALREAEAAGFTVEHINLGTFPTREFAYCAAILARWQRPDDWLFVEHDLEPTVETLTAMAECPELLCSRPYAIFEGDDKFIDQIDKDRPLDSVGASLGCTKITAAARRKLTTVPTGRWGTYDGYLTVALRNAAGGYWHLHYEPLTHHHRHAGDPRLVYT